MRKLAIIAVSCMTALTSIVVPAQAYPTISPQKIEASDVQLVRDRGDWENRRYLRRHRDGRRGGYYGGRSYREGRRHYRRRDDDDNDIGAFIGGLAAGAIISGLINSQPRAYSGGGSHTRWCYARYRSYRAYDNTFQPYGGPRQQCYSPYR